MILLTGAAGFVGSNVLAALNEAGMTDIMAVDNLGFGPKWKNLNGKKFLNYFPKQEFLKFIEDQNPLQTIAADFTFIYHMGACSSTAEKNVEYLIENNFKYSVAMFQLATKLQIPFVYASSAATYGAGENGFDDDASKIHALKPLNPYGYSKQLFDMWVLKQKETPPFWCGLKFFNVYGPNEYHKEGQFSVVYKAFREIIQTGKMQLFKSYSANYKDGEQKRDFIYVKDISDVMLHILENFARSTSGIYNLGTGRAQSFLELAQALFTTLKKNKEIEWTEMPDSLKNQYQYFTEAKMLELRKNLGFEKSFQNLEMGVSDYVNQFLIKSDAHR